MQRDICLMLPLLGGGAECRTGNENSRLNGPYWLMLFIIPFPVQHSAYPPGVCVCVCVCVQRLHEIWSLNLKSKMNAKIV